MVQTESGVHHEILSCADVWGIAFCAGAGKRLIDITHGEIPKPLVNLKNIPLIEYSLLPLYQAGVTKFVFTLGSNGRQIVDYVAQKSQEIEWGKIQASFSYEDPPMGIAIGLRQALENCNISGEIVVFDADAVRLGLDFADAYNFHRHTSATTTLVCTSVVKPKNSNFVVFNDNSGQTALIAMETEGLTLSSNIIKCGMMICSTEATNFIKNHPCTTNSWIGLLEHLSLLGKMRTYITPKPLVYANVNTPEELTEIEQLLEENQ